MPLLVLRDGVHAAVHRAAAAARAARAAARARRRALSRRGRSVMRLLRVLLSPGCCWLGAGASCAARSRSRRPTSSCRSTNAPPASRCRRSPLLGAAYGFVWVALFGYVWSLGAPAAEGRSARSRELESQEAARWRSACPTAGALHLHPGGAAGRDRDRLDSRLARRAGRLSRRSCASAKSASSKSRDGLTPDGRSSVRAPVAGRGPRAALPRGCAPAPSQSDTSTR